MTGDLAGQVYSLLAAVMWAFALVLFKRSGETVPPMALNLFKNTVGVILLAVTLLILEGGFGAIAQESRADIYILVISGFVGIALADTVFFYGLNLVGVGIAVIVDCLYSPLVILFSWLMLSEKLLASHYAGAALILAGVFMSSRHAPPPNRTRGQLIAGVLLTASSMAMMAIGIVIAKPVLHSGLPFVWAATVRLLVGTAALAIFMSASARREEIWSVFQPSPVWRFSLPASVLGSYFSMLLWIAGFTFTAASVAGILNQMSTIFAIILAAILLKEPLTLRKGVSVTVAMAGVVLVTLGSRP